MAAKNRDVSELEILQALDRLLRMREIREATEGLACEIRADLEGGTTELLVYRSVPLSLFPDRLPEQIRSSWIFGIQRGARTGAERHPRSHQRMMSYLASGDLQVWDGKRWISRRLVSDQDEKIGRRWISIPPNVWHQACAEDAIWVVVSFHTVSTHELVEERPDPDDPMITHKRTYLPR